MSNEPIVSKKALIITLAVLTILIGAFIYQNVTKECTSSKCVADRIIEFEENNP